MRACSIVVVRRRIFDLDYQQITSKFPITKGLAILDTTFPKSKGE